MYNPKCLKIKKPQISYKGAGDDRLFHRSLLQGCSSEALQGSIHGRPVE